MHKTFDVAPASDVNGVYSFALGTDPVSFDWGIYTPDTKSVAGMTALLTITNIGTGQTTSYNPFFLGNDNTNGPGYSQNSYRLNWAGIGFNSLVDDTYSVTLDVANLDGGNKSLTVYAKLGTGAVPEPATWAMMVLGFGALGGALRKKQASAAARALA